MTETTTNHGWEIPEVGGSKDVWGQILNDFFDGELDEEVALKGPFSERPIAGGDVSNLYLATDRRIVYYNDGTSWEAVYGLGTEEEPVPGTSHFDSVHTGETHTERIGGEGRHFAADYPGSTADDRLTNALNTASSADTIILESDVAYTTNRTFTTRYIFVGSAAFLSGTIIDADWTFDNTSELTRVGLDPTAHIHINSDRCKVINCGAGGATTITVDADQFIFSECRGCEITFESGTAGGIVDTSTQTTVTDNGSNTVGDIA